MQIDRSDVYLFASVTYGSLWLCVGFEEISGG
jgi:hypothetical protein